MKSPAIQRFVVCTVVVAILATRAASPAPDDDRTLLLRVEPTQVRWAEIDVAEGGDVEVPASGETRSYPFSLAISCSERERKETVGSVVGASALPARRLGSVYVAGDTHGSRDAWNDLREVLIGRVAALTPDTFTTFARRFRDELFASLDASHTEDFSGVVCVAVTGESDQAVDVRRRRDEDGGVSSTSSGFRDGRAVCARLSGRLEGAPPVEVLASRFLVGSAGTESLRLRTRLGPGREGVSWPEDSGVRFGKAPPGAASYSRSQRDIDGWADYEELRSVAPGGSTGGPAPYLVQARARDASIPASALDGDAVLMRWTWRLRTVRLGIDPKTISDETATVDIALLFPERSGRRNVDAYASAVAREFDLATQPRGVPLLTSVLVGQTREIGIDPMFAVVCRSDEPDATRFAIAGATARVLNARDFCSALAARLD